MIPCVFLQNVFNKILFTRVFGTRLVFSITCIAQPALTSQGFYSCGSWLRPPEVRKGKPGLRREQVGRLGGFWDM